MLCVFKAGHHNSPAILKREYGFKKTLPLAKREYPKGEGDENNAVKNLKERAFIRRLQFSVFSFHISVFRFDNTR